MLSIKNPKVDVLVTRLAKERGTSKTQLVLQGLELLEQQSPTQNKINIGDELMAAAERISAMPQLSNKSIEEIIGYDENGLPT